MRYFKAPQKFSLVDNSVEMIEFFERISIDANRQFKKIFFIDLSGVRYITVDAIMYLLAVVRNIKWNVLKNTVRGNLPKDRKCEHIVESSGFLQYVKVNGYNLNYAQTSDSVQIIEGQSTDGTKVQKIVDFVNAKNKSLFEIILELMDNTVSHAYDKLSNEKDLSRTGDRWYIYVSKAKNKYYFSFVDTGFGIPSTVRKKLLADLFGGDAELIKSALLGENRTGTRKSNHGNGLPHIYEQVQAGRISDLKIISGKGLYSYNNDNHTCINVEHSLKGTIFTWSI